MSVNKGKKRKAESFAPSLLEEFCSITGTDNETALHFLEACEGQLDAAVTLFLDGNGNAVRDDCASRDSVTSERSSHHSQSDEGTSSNVREPIPQKTEVLVEHYLTSGKRSRRGPKTVFDSFRDFAAEANPSWSKHQRNLSELFRPPLDLTHKGSFYSAKSVGSNENKWLAVNVQNNQEFACLCLNRDVWSHSDVKRIVKNNFILWQVNHDSDNGEEFMRFYKIKQWPYIAILDPRTGELMITWSGQQLDASTFCALANNFLLEHPVPDEQHSSLSAAGSCSNKEKPSSLIDLSEDSQIEAAIRASLAQTNNVNHDVDSIIDDSSDDSVETFSDSEPELPTAANTVRKPETVPKTVSVKKLSNGHSGDSSTKNSNHLYSSHSLEKQKTLQKEFDSDTVSSISSEGSDIEPVLLASDNESESIDGSDTRMNWPSGRRKLKPDRKVASTLVEVINDSQSESRDIDVGTERSGDSEWTKEITSKPSEENSNSYQEISSSGLSSKCGSLSSLPTEVNGESNSGRNIKLLFRFPNGNKRNLELSETSKLQAVYNFCQECGYAMNEYDCVTHYPRRNWSTFLSTQTLKELQLHSQETVFVQNKTNEDS